jgi:hypothetical protein
MPNHDDKGRALARFAINTITSSRVGNILLPKKKMKSELKQAAGKRSLINDPRNLKGKERKKYADSLLQDLRKRHFGMANPRLDKTNFKQEAPELYNKKNPLNYHGGDPGEEKMGPKKKRLRKISDLPGYDPKGYMGGYAPGFGRIKKVGQMLKAFSNTPKQQLQIKNFIKMFRGSQSAKSKVTGLSDDFFRGVKESLEKNPKLKKSSSGYYIFKK